MMDRRVMLADEMDKRAFSYEVVDDNNVVG